MVKICLLLPDLRGGGAERVSLDLGHAFAGLGELVEFALMRRPGEFLSEAAAAFFVPDVAAPSVRQVLPGLTNHLRCSRPDVVLAAALTRSVDRDAPKARASEFAADHVERRYLDLVGLS